MGKEHEPIEGGAETEDAAFDALLKRAAQVSRPVPVSRLGPDTSLVSGRLKIVRRLGAGGMGVVFEAYDEGRKANVALKTLNRLSPNDVYRLKNEFRSLVDVVHPNLCRLYELFHDAQQWLFTMELIHGVPFDTWVRPSGALDEARLRAALPPLCSAIDAIHEAGKLHRDLKPSNVLVTQQARIVVLDFGLVVDPEPGSAGMTLPEFNLSGTPVYMGPEQAAGVPATEATDRYALGVMLFEALTGRPPFVGSMLDVLTAKQEQPARRARSFAPNVPEDLDALCDALLAREPAQRIDANGLRAWFAQASTAPRRPGTRASDHGARRRHAVVIDLATLQTQVDAALRGAAQTEPAVPPVRATPVAAAPSALAPEPIVLLGRDVERSKLLAAFQASCTQQKPVIVLLAGESGIGKSALCEAVLGELRAVRSAVVLSGRCFERELVPFKAFDVVVDELSRYLRRLGDDARACMPLDAFALQRVFPVLGRTAALAAASPRDVADAQELRRRGFAAFTELLGRIRQRHPLVIHLDDLQWSDADSTRLLMHVLTEPGAPPLLWILSHRSEQMEDHPHLSPLYRALPRVPGLDVRPLALGPLAPAAARALLSPELFGIETEVAGNPFLLGELSRHAELRTRKSSELSVRAMIAARAAALSEPERKLMEIVAVASRPIDLELAIEAASVTAAPRTLFESLRDANLLRATGHGAAIECFHDKVREAILRNLSSDRLRGCHAALASSLAARADVGAEQLAVHWLGAGRTQEAALQLVRAADAALTELSFDRAARLYAQALEHGQFHAEELQRISAALGDARNWAAAGPMKQRDETGRREDGKV